MYIQKKEVCSACVPLGWTSKATDTHKLSKHMAVTTIDSQSEQHEEMKGCRREMVRNKKETENENI